VELIRHRLESKGLELLVLDQTRPDVGIPVARVIVPGMRPFWTRLAPGRLYDVPVELGKQPMPTAYENLNPYPMFL
jgi:ribosomal protein S12 methylthiotransferase accessory factor